MHPNLTTKPSYPECSDLLLEIKSDTSDTNSEIADTSDNNCTITKIGDVKHTTDIKIQSSSSINFDGDNDILHIEDEISLDGDFTFEAWVNTNKIPVSDDFSLHTELQSTFVNDDILEISENTTLDYTNDRVSSISENKIGLTNLSGDDFKVNQRLLLITTYGTNADSIGNYEFVEIDSISNKELTLKTNIVKSYDAENFTFVVAPKRYKKIIVNEGVNVSTTAWSKSTDAIQGLVLLSADEVHVNGTISANQIGFRGGNIGTPSDRNGGIGETYVDGYWNTRGRTASYGAGGAGRYGNRGSIGDVGTSGAGAGHGTVGGNGSGGGGWPEPAIGGIAFALENQTIKQKLFMGPGGGQGASDTRQYNDSGDGFGGAGGNGGGIIIIDAIHCEVGTNGIISANGQNGAAARDPKGSSEPGNGGGGAGGSILFTGNLNNKGVIETKYGDKNTSVGYASGRGGNGVIAWFGYRTGVIPKNCLSHHHWKNTSFIVDGREKTSETFGENQFGLLVVPNQDRTKYKFAYGNLGNNIPRIDADVEFNEWTHIAIVRSGNLETFYIDGCPQNTRSNSVSYDNTNLYIGSQSIKEFNLPLPFKGNLQDFRFSNKVVYEGCFSPPKEFKTNCVGYIAPTITPTPTFTCPINDYPRYEKSTVSSGGSKHAIGNLGNAFDGDDTTHTNETKLTTPYQSRLDRFVFDNSQNQTPGKLRIYVKAGTNSSHTRHASLYIRYRKPGGDWVYLINTNKKYMPYWQDFKYEVDLDSVDRVDINWKDLGLGMISYMYHYIEFVQDCPAPPPTITPTPTLTPTLTSTETQTPTPTYTCKVTDVASWDGTSGAGTRSGPSDINKAFDRNDSTYTGWAKVIYSQSWRQDRFKFNNVQTHTPGTLRFRMYGGVNVGIYAEKADMYIRYRELGGSWVYLRNVKNSYMPNPQNFKYEVQVDSVDRVDVYWKDIGQGSISYRYHYVEFVHDCPEPTITPTKTALYCPDPNEPSCEEVALNIQSNTDVTRSVTLQWYMMLPNHSLEDHRNGTLSHSQTFDITEDVTKVDQWFMYSNSKVLGVNSGNWTASAQPGGVNPNKANLTYNDTGETIVVDLTNRKLTLAGGGAGHNLTFNFDVPYGKELPAIEDISKNAHTITKNGDVKHTSEVKVLGDSSLYFDGNGDYLIVENSNNLNFGSSDYTVELWVNTPNTVSTNTSSATQIIGKHTTGSVTNSSWLLLHITASKQLQWQEYSGETSYKVNVTIPDNTWVHIAVVKNNNTLKMYKDGVLESETTVQGAMNTSTSRTLIGAVNHNGSLDTINYAQMFNGYLQDIRVSKKAVYTGCFIPPSSLHELDLTEPNEPSCEEVALNIQSNTTNEADPIQDNSQNAHTITKNGDVKHTSEVKVLGESSLYFDGNGDYLTTSVHNDFSFNADDFTVEFNVYLMNANFAMQSNSVLSTSEPQTIWHLHVTGQSVLFTCHSNGQGLYHETTIDRYKWHHIAFVRKSGKLTAFVNGLAVKTVDFTANLLNNGLAIGSHSEASGVYPMSHCYLQDLRISKKAVYTGCFIPPTHFHQDCPEQPSDNLSTAGCSDDLIIVKEYGENKDMLGISGIYKNSDFQDFSSMGGTYNRFSDFQGNFRRKIWGAGSLRDQFGTKFWTPSSEYWGYSDYVNDNPSDSAVEFQFFDKDNQPTTCIGEATSVNFHDKPEIKVPISVQKMEIVDSLCVSIKDFPEFSGLYVANDMGSRYDLIGNDGELLASFSTDEERWQWQTRTNIFDYLWNHAEIDNINPNVNQNTPLITDAFVTVAGASNTDDGTFSAKYVWDAFCSEELNKQNTIQTFNLHNDDKTPSVFEIKYRPDDCECALQEVDYEYYVVIDTQD